MRHAITAGQPVTQGSLVHPDDRGFLAAALGAGMRAVTVRVSQEQGVGGFVFPGDRVDVILAQTLEVKEGSSYPDEQLHTAETIVQNIRVLATDQRFEAEDDEGKTPVRTFGTVTLEATPEIAQRIAVAQSMGKLSLSLRPLAESAGEIDAAIASGAVNVPTSGNARDERRMLSSVNSRPTSGKANAVSGGDVSRYWIPMSAVLAVPRRRVVVAVTMLAPLRAFREAVPPSPLLLAAPQCALCAAMWSKKKWLEATKMNAMKKSAMTSIARTAAIALMAGSLVAAPAAPLFAQATQNATSNVDLSVGRGRLVTLPAPMSDVFVANDKVADVQIRSQRQLYIFGKEPGETSIYATDASGRVVFSTVARVGNNIETIDQMLSLAMPDAAISANTMNGFVLLTGTVQSPDDAAEAQMLVEAFVGEKTKVLSRLRTATPLQVNCRCAWLK